MMQQIRAIWTKYYSIILRVTIGLLGVAALSRLSYQFARLVWLSDANGAIDLAQRHEEVQLWFSGEPVYSLLYSAVYPPASYAILWPFLGFPSLAFTRWFWAITTILGLILLSYILIKESQAENLTEKVLLVMILLAMYPTGDNVGNGQLCIHSLSTLVAGLTIICSQKNGWVKDILAGSLLVFSLVKPTLTAPFFVIVLFIPGRLRPILIVILGYLILALIAAAFQDYNIVSLHHDWLSRSLKGASWSSSGGGIDKVIEEATIANRIILSGFKGYGNLHSLLGILGLNKWNLPASLLLLFALGYWTYVYRKVDLWIIIGVVAIFSRLWAYHRVYDDILVILPMLTLFRLSKHNFSPMGKILSRILFGISIFAILVPSWMRMKSSPWDDLFIIGQTSFWSVMLGFLFYVAWHQKKQQSS